MWKRYAQRPRGPRGRAAGLRGRGRTRPGRTRRHRRPPAECVRLPTCVSDIYFFTGEINARRAARAEPQRPVCPRCVLALGRGLTLTVSACGRLGVDGATASSRPRPRRPSSSSTRHSRGRGGRSRPRGPARSPDRAGRSQRSQWRRTAAAPAKEFARTRENSQYAGHPARGGAGGDGRWSTVPCRASRAGSDVLRVRLPDHRPCRPCSSLQ